MTRRRYANHLLALLITSVIALQCAGAEERETKLPDSTTIRFLLEQPKKDIPGHRRLCVVLAGGRADRDAANWVMKSLGKPMVERGWVSIAPISSDRRPLFGENADKVLSLVRVLKKGGLAGGSVLIIGSSNGGIAAFELASSAPSEFCGVVAVPGLLSGHVMAATLKGLPVYVRIGEKDNLGWGRHYRSTVKRLRKAGVIVDARLLKNTGHGIPLKWEELDAWMLRSGISDGEQKKIGKEDRRNMGAVQSEGVGN